MHQLWKPPLILVTFYLVKISVAKSLLHEGAYFLSLMHPPLFLMTTFISEQY